MDEFSQGAEFSVAAGDEGAVSPAAGITVLPALTEQQERFAAYIAVGASIRRASAQVGVSDRTGRRWLAEEAMQAQVLTLAQERGRLARRIVVGSVVQAARTLRRLMRQGGAAHKGAPTELMAAMAVLKLNRIDMLDAADVRRTILSRVPRDGDLRLQAGEDTLQELEDLYRESDLPHELDPETGLPPGYPRTTQDLQDQGHAPPAGYISPDLKDPDYWRGGR